MTQSIKRAITDVILAKLADGFWFTGLGWSVFHMADEDDVNLIRWVIENDYIRRPLILEAVHKGICACGRRSFIEHVNLSTPPDHTASPRALGYAIRHGVITKEEAEQIRFDHGETVNEYIKNSEGLLDWAMEELKRVPDKEWNQGSCLNCGVIK